MYFTAAFYTKTILIDMTMLFATLRTIYAYLHKLGNLPVERAKDTVCFLQRCGVSLVSSCAVCFLQRGGVSLASSAIIYNIVKVTCWPVDPFDPLTHWPVNPVCFLQRGGMSLASSAIIYNIVKVKVTHWPVWPVDPWTHWPVDPLTF